LAVKISIGKYSLNPILLENQKKGTLDWRLDKAGADPQSLYRHPRIEGYASSISVKAGENLDFMVSTNPPSPFRVEFFRLGYYQGLGGRHLLSLGPFPGETQPDPSMGPERLYECDWQPSFSLPIPADWPSGVFLAKLTAEKQGWQSYVIFIVRDDRKADFNFQCATNTWVAYNRWPKSGSLYDDGEHFWYWGPDVRVSYDKPFALTGSDVIFSPLTTGSGEFLLWEFPLSYWMEGEGFDVTYTSNLDTHLNPEGLLRTKGFLSAGHDEYWSLEMFENVQKSVAAGLNAAFLCGNSLYGRVDLVPGKRGPIPRRFSRQGIYAPAGGSFMEEFPEMKRLKHFGPNANGLMGVMSMDSIIGCGPWICAKEDHWLMDGTGMKNGDGIPGLVGWEYHKAPADLPGLEVVGRGPVRVGNKRDEFSSVIFNGPKKNWVFNASTIWWSDGLSEPPGHLRVKSYGDMVTGLKGPDPRVQTITRNFLNRVRQTDFPSTV
jgi:hypothetical protein